MKTTTFFALVVLIVIFLVSQFSWVRSLGNSFSVFTDKDQEYNKLLVFGVSKSSTSSSTNVREWGCGRTETPFIFVHIHKAGGGSIKGRIAASSLNFTSEDPKLADGSYYPIITAEANDTTSSSQKKARLCWSGFAHRRPSNETAYEGSELCHASTPIGRSIACGEPPQKVRNVVKRKQLEGCRAGDDTCRLVYVGHNLFGSEFHWLPATFLKNWWEKTIAKAHLALPSQSPDQVVTTNTDNDSEMLSLWDKAQYTKSLDPKTNDLNQIWCSTSKMNITRPNSYLHYRRYYNECSIPLQRQVDKAAIEAVVPFIKSTNLKSNIEGRRQKQSQDSGGGGEVQSWSPIYASLPVLRATMVREPFSWLSSKFFWHKANVHDGLEPHRDLQCDDIENAIIPNFDRPQKLHSRTTIPGWITRMSLEYLMWLCGEDCIVRYWKGESTLEDLQNQAEGNLRYGFAVVGVLESGDEEFYEMLSARVQYIDTSLNPEVLGHRHSSGRRSHPCKEKLKNDKEFQQKLLSLSPELRVINHLYQVAVEVNRFQLSELRTCSKRMDSFLSNRTQTNRIEATETKPGT